MAKVEILLEPLLAMLVLFIKLHGVLIHAFWSLPRRIVQQNYGRFQVGNGREKRSLGMQMRFMPLIGVQMEVA